MGRRDAVQVTLEFAAEWRLLGARVTFESGWETRGNGMMPNYEGAHEHHTGFGSSASNPFPARNTLINGRPDLRGPLCNSAGPWCADDDPWIHVIAAFPANHAGASGGYNTAPFPVTSLFNPLSWGHEIDYGGNVSMSLGQRKAALIVGRGVTNVLGKDIAWVKAHAETSVTGKWDPGYLSGKTIDMAAFRRDAAALTLEDDMAGVGEEIKDILWEGNDIGTPKSATIYQRVRRLEGVLYQGIPASPEDGAGTPHAETVFQRLRRVEDKLDELLDRLPGSGPAA